MTAKAPPPFRVLMIAATSFFADYGCHVRILEEARVLTGLGHRVTVCTYHNGRDLPDVDIRRTMVIPWREGYEVGSSRHKIGFDVLLFLRALSLMPTLRPHVLHAHGYEAALIANVLHRLWGTPVVFDRQGSLTGEMIDHGFLRPEGRALRYWKRLEHALDCASPCILTSSAHAASLMTAPEVAHKVTCLPDCVDTEAFAPKPRDGAWIAQRQSYGIPDGRQVVVYLGLLAKYQGTDHLLRAAQRVVQRRHDVHFLIAGFPNVEHYQQRAQEMGIAGHVTFPGRVPYQDAPSLLSLGDVAVGPKLSQTEGAGKLLNYMAMALPTVAFDTEVSREYLGSDGVLARRGDSDDLAEKLRSLLADGDRRRRIGTALRRRAMDLFGWDRAAKLILQAYRELCGVTVTADAHS